MEIKDDKRAAAELQVLGQDIRMGEQVRLGYFCVIGDGVTIEDGVCIGDGSIIGAGAVIGKGVVISRHVIIEEKTVLCDGVTIMDQAVIGKQPFRAKRSVLQDRGSQDPCIIEEGCTIGTASIVYAGAVLEQDVFVADLATVRERVRVGAGTIIGRGASVENDCTVGARCKLETNCYITAYSTIGDDVFVAPGVITSNDNFIGRTKERFKWMKGLTVKKGGRLGAGVVTLPGVVIEVEAVVAAGSVVTKDVEGQQLVMGIPARVLRQVAEEQLLQHQ